VGMSSLEARLIVGDVQKDGCKSIPCDNCVIDISNKTCPSCRAKVTKVTDDFRANSLLDVYLKMNPTKARSAEELEELDKEYKRGVDVLLH
jgi:E3 ubiquitin-protein ligase CHFR